MPPIAIRVRTASGWQDIAVQGPAGPAQTWVGPNPPSPRGDYVQWIDTDEANPAVTDARVTALEGVRLLDIRRINGSGGADKAFVSSGTVIYADAANTIPMRLSYTPPVAAWWDVYAHIAHTQKTDAAYHYGYLDVTLTPSDVDGIGFYRSLITQHSTVQQYEAHSIDGLFKLAASTAYTVEMRFGWSGGTWLFPPLPTHLWLTGKAWVR